MKAQEDLKIYFSGKIHFVLGLLARDIANHSYASNIPLTQALNPIPLLSHCLVLTILEKRFIYNFFLVFHIVYTFAFYCKFKILNRVKRI